MPMSNMRRYRGRFPELADLWVGRWVALRRPADKPDMPVDEFRAFVRNGVQYFSWRSSKRFKTKLSKGKTYIEVTRIS